MLLELDATDSAPLYQQVAAAVRRALIDGALKPGDSLPPARETADAIGVNMHTVLRGYAELQQEGLIVMRRGRGVTVCGVPAGRVEMLDRVRELVSEARRHGVRRADLVAMIEAVP